MTDTAKNNIRDTVNILMQLDQQSLLLIDSSARVLLARQEMDSDFQKNKQLQEA